MGNKVLKSNVSHKHRNHRTLLQYGETKDANFWNEEIAQKCLQQITCLYVTVQLAQFYFVLALQLIVIVEVLSLLRTWQWPVQWNVKGKMAGNSYQVTSIWGCCELGGRNSTWVLINGVKIYLKIWHSDRKRVKQICMWIWNVIYSLQIPSKYFTIQCLSSSFVRWKSWYQSPVLCVDTAVSSPKHSV